ncbi:MAG: GNAT family N-acetyltransferase [Deltaproteobacteria bacterium]|nr:GNAT family N-acetyltransferase [Deltaproteobacteria bacterium]
MGQSPVLETGRLLIEPFSERHLSDRYVGWLNDPEVVRLSEQRFRTHTPESCREYMRSFEGTPNHFWAILSRLPREGHVGNVNASVDARNGVADIGILIGEKRLWGKGYGLEAFRAVTSFLFGQVGVRKVTAGTTSINLGMLRIMERMGMEPDGLRLRHVLIDGQETDLIHAALFREKWRLEMGTSEGNARV